MERYCPVQPVELRPLTAASLTRLAEQVLASTTVDPDLVRWLARASEGNPLYVQEYLWFLQDTHAKGVCCVRRTRRWRSVLAEEAGPVRRPRAVRSPVERSAFAGFRFSPR
jgi:hypothetical protein